MPNSGVPYVPPSITAPTTLGVATDATTPISGISVQDSYEAATGTPMTVVLADLAGQLSVAPVGGVQESGQGTMQITLTGALGGINTALGSLAYDEPFARMPVDFLSVAATDDRNTSTFAQVQVGPGSGGSSGGSMSIPPGLPGSGTSGPGGGTAPGHSFGDGGRAGMCTGMAATTRSSSRPETTPSRRARATT